MVDVFDWNAHELTLKETAIGADAAATRLLELVRLCVAEGYGVVNAEIGQANEGPSPDEIVFGSTYELRIDAVGL